MDAGEFCIGDFASFFVLAGVEFGVDLQAGLGGGVADEVDDDFVGLQRFAAPVAGDMAEQPMFDLVPLAGAGRKMADLNLQPCFVGQLFAARLSTADCERCCCRRCRL